MYVCVYVYVYVYVHVWMYVWMYVYVHRTRSVIYLPGGPPGPPETPDGGPDGTPKALLHYVGDPHIMEKGPGGSHWGPHPVGSGGAGRPPRQHRSV